jgi:hypothetical protein
LITLDSSGLKVKALDDNLSAFTDELFFGRVLLKPSAECTLLQFPSFILLLLFIFSDAEVKLLVVGLKIGSTAGIPTRVRRSASMADFNRTSRGLSQPRDGDRFTSNSHGFKLESIKISNP